MRLPEMRKAASSPVWSERIRYGRPSQKADVLHVGAGRTRWGGDVRVEDGQVEALVLGEPHLGVDLELEPVRRGGGVAPGLVALGPAVAEETNPQASFGASAWACSSSARRTPAGTTTRRGSP